jgi:hypothetical protein
MLYWSNALNVLDFGDNGINFLKCEISQGVNTGEMYQRECLEGIPGNLTSSRTATAGGNRFC